MELNTQQMLIIFGVTPMTVYNWRTGLGKWKSSKLPYHTHKFGTRHRIYFKWGEVRQWSIKNRVEVKVHPSKLPTELSAY